jgi:glycosyltransferase involved in cell wall biosynthesis
LKSIKNQSYKKTEIIVVDNNSTDDTKLIAREYTNKVFNKGPERSAQRNFGVSKSKGSWVLYLDADMILSRRVIEDCVKHIKPGIVGMFIPEIVTGNSYWSKVRRFERSFYDGTVIDCVRFVDKKVFQKVGGFDLSLTGPEDWDFDKKVRQEGRVLVIKESLNHNESEFNMEKYLAKKSYYSKSINAYIKKWGCDNPDIKKQLGFYYRFFGVFFEQGKWKKLITHPLLTFGMYYLKFRVGLNYLKRSVK